MTVATLEHVNVTVSNPRKTAEFLCRVFNWHIRWHGPSSSGGTTYHVGNKAGYLAVYSGGNSKKPHGDSGGRVNGLNHIAIVVDDLDAIESKVKSEGIHTHNHGDYEPGRRFYFHDDDGIEFEIVSYPGESFWARMGEIARSGMMRN